MNSKAALFASIQERGFFTHFSFSKAGFIFYLFSYLWSVQFVLGVSSMTISGAIGEWYFHKREDRVFLLTNFHNRNDTLFGSRSEPFSSSIWAPWRLGAV